MKTLRFFVRTCLVAFAAQSIFAGIQNPVTVFANSTSRPEKGVPCYLVLEKGDFVEPLESSGGLGSIIASLERKGYVIVDSPQEAKEFIKIGYARGEATNATLTHKRRSTMDYSNAASTRNYAATSLGGRYSELSNPSNNRDRGDVGYMIGPSGEVIDVGDQPDIKPEIVEGEESAAQVIIVPVYFSIASWKIDPSSSTSEPVGLWSVRAEYPELESEPLEDQLGWLSKLAAKHIGKNYRQPKTIRK